MATTITAGNSTNGAAISSDNTGILELKTGTGSGTTAMTIDTGQQVAVTLGSAAAPAITFSGDTNTGIFSPAADTIAFSEGGVESMRIDASGNLLVGATSALGPAANRGNITVNGATDAILAFGNAASLAGYILQDSGGMTLFSSGATYQRFYTNNTERARIDSSGNLLVGDTAAGAGAERFLVKSAGTSSATAGVRVINSGGTELFFIRSDGAFRTGSASVSPYNNTTGSAANVWINTDGTLLRSTSSLKYKNNVQDATHGLAELLVLRPVTYEGKAESDAGKTFGGLIAEEVHDAGLTEFVQYAEDGTPDALAYGNMVSLCIKAIQELKAELDATKAEVALLKGAA
jgi:hypothetical protein